MLKRIAYVGKKNAQYKRLLRAAKGVEAQIVALGAGDEVPPSAVAVFAAGERMGDVIKAAVALGERNESVLDLLAEAIDGREGFPEGSSRRVMEHAARFALALGLSPEERLTLERAALVRDIGKIRIPNEVLLKKGVLTYDEWRLLQQHPNLGADIAARTSALRDTEDIVRRHHECYDGDGYPEGLEGDAIPYLARVMKLLDVYCAMTSPRHYRKGQSTHREAVKYLRGEQGKHFDPQLVEVFISADVGRTGTHGSDAKRTKGKKAKKV
jgi:response regulator RpfG family c-di-GMP phosphodiesterase